MSISSIVDTEQARRQIAAELGREIKPDDPILVTAALAIIATRQVIDAERAKHQDKSVIGYTDLRSVHQRIHQETAALIDNVVGAVLNRVSAALDVQIRSIEMPGPEYLKIGFVFAAGAGSGAVGTLAFLFVI